jgi:cell division protein ZapA (FtsZ GTPase activity inhibitor)
MKKILLLILLLISGITYSQIQVIHFNANWNATNDVKWVGELTDCKLKNIDIATNTQAATDHKITVVPTILVLVDGEEEERYEADISFSMQATKKEIQEVIDEIVMDQF